ncbi:hypothetical protein ACIPIC_35540 [Streptomyces collinus]|uniref:hypothetical protein n=1 Tax=Streptomyces collinus TaxID=42684 RepID=UPI003820239B
MRPPGADVARPSGHRRHQGRIIGTTTAVEVDSPDRSRPFAVLDAAYSARDARRPASIRSAQTPPGRVRAVLQDKDIDADIQQVPAPLEEKVVIIDRASDFAESQTAGL